METIAGIFENGVFRPLGPVNMPESTQVMIVPREEYAQLYDDYVRRELQVAFEQADRGDWKPLDMEAIIAEANRRHCMGAGVLTPAMASISRE